MKSIQAQSPRLNTKNQIVWIAPTLTFKINKKFSIHSEYQWRRSDWGKIWQQGLLRLGINYQLNPRVLARIGYAWAETYPYGEYSLNSMGKDFTEHRSFQLLQLTQKEMGIDFIHRFILEQRWIGRYTQSNLNQEDEYPLMHRARYMMRGQKALSQEKTKLAQAYIAFYDEVFIGFGKNVNANIFDQNRLAMVLGYKIHPKVRVELGALNQTLQYGRRINDKNVFQYNTGIVINATTLVGK